MKIKRRTSNCLNCGRTLDKVYNYCPNCGQGNHDDNVSFGMLVGDFLGTYFALDSKFGKTLKPFFLKPGFLTNQYTIGKRTSYAHPLRLYLIVSIFYFFTVTLFAKYESKDKTDPVIKSSNSSEILDKVNGLTDSTKFQILGTLSSRERKKLKKELKKNNLVELKSFISTLDSADQIDIREAVGDSVANRLGVVKATKTSAKKHKSNDEGFILARIDYKKIKKLDKDYDLTDDQIYDSLALGDLDYFDGIMAQQAIRVTRARNEQIVEYITKNLPVMMLLLIPIFALVLKLLYIRRKELYIKHLIHALHLHSFAYLLYGIFILISIYLAENEGVRNVLNIIAFMVVSAYAYISFLRVYKQHWFKSFVKFLMTGFIYGTAIVVFFIFETMISLLLF